MAKEILGGVCEGCKRPLYSPEPLPMGESNHDLPPRHDIEGEFFKQREDIDHGLNFKYFGFYRFYKGDLTTVIISGEATNISIRPTNSPPNSKHVEPSNFEEFTERLHQAIETIFRVRQ